MAGFRPMASSGAIPNGLNGVVPQRMQALVECGWHQEHEIRHSAGHMSTVIQEEIDEHLVLHHMHGQVVGTEQTTVPLSQVVQI